MKVGLVLGAGGVVGAAWLIGALEALSDETGWDPSESERIIGTSAGSVVGAFVAAGLSPQVIAGYAAGATPEDSIDAADRVDAIAEQIGGDEMRLALAPPPIGPGSWRLAIETTLHPRRHSPTAMLAGWLPRGFVSTQPITSLVETFVQSPWPQHPGYRAIAADYATGKRVPFGAAFAPPATVGQAVAASCAIPGFYHPVKIAGRRYIDGGICSMSNLDLCRGEGFDLVVCLNPTSSLAVTGRTPAEIVGGVLRGPSGRRLGHEARKLRAEGTEVLLLQPSATDVKAMGVNLMARGRRVAVLEHARRSTALTLRDLRGSGRLMPGKQKRRRMPAAARRAQAA